MRVLIANRGEVSVRVARTVRELGWQSVAVYAADDATSGHVRAADAAVALSGSGPAAYLDTEQFAALASEHDCALVHPGWGFASEDYRFAERCLERGIAFAGPRPEVLKRFADKAAARALAEEVGVPVLPATPGASSVAEIAEFMDELGGPIMIKALSGGGGRGIRVVSSVAELHEAYERCRAEARLATGLDAVYAEALVERARHIEVQVVGDVHGSVLALGERDCSVQRRNQKVIEIAPAPGISAAHRAALADAALALARAAGYDNLGTFEFLLDTDSNRFFFIEANPRLQVEHGVTEMVTGLDLVALQLQLALGMSLVELDVAPDQRPRGLALEARINLREDIGEPSPIETFEPPKGPGIRFDTFVYPGYVPNPRYDRLVAKIIGWDPDGDLSRAAELVERGLDEMRISGPALDTPLLREVLQGDAFRSGRFTTRLLDETIEAAAPTSSAGSGDVDTVSAPLTGIVIEVKGAGGATLGAGTVVLVLEALKMHHEIVMPVGGRVEHVAARVGEQIHAGDTLFSFTGIDGAAVSESAGDQVSDPDASTPELDEVIALERKGLDESRPEATARRHAKGHNTIRENLALLCDADSWMEHGALVAPLQSEWADRAPADGVLTGTASINGALFPGRSKCAVFAHDETVIAGTHGYHGMDKIQRLAERARQQRLPTVMFAEGGGGRSGEPHHRSLSGLILEAYVEFARLTCVAPVVAVVSRFCFAGNAVLAGVAHTIVATKDASMGMAGPPMIEGAGLGSFAPEEIAPIETLVASGSVDVVVDSDEEAIAVVRKYLGYFQGSVDTWEIKDQRRLRHLVPANTRQVFDMRAVLETLFDDQSLLELREGFGRACITALARIGGQSVGVIASDPRHLAAAIDADAADKVARFMQLCDAFGLPIVSLVDTPGFMVGPDHERAGLVRHTSRLFVAGASLTTQIITVIVRRAYGLGALALAGGSTREPFVTVAWPTAELGGEGLEGTVQITGRSELAAIEDPDEREALFQRKLGELRALTSPIAHARNFEFDALIDPAKTRDVILRALDASPPAWHDRAVPGRAMVDTW
jgi:acetyl/propionyl-CoA carboxylase alpha subunit/acetyl-CoA carboxylase carboxyltransferase component